jgi:predicted NAD-dependent protein-ADP-ribosyltransferase YbiA (DUF1768 family)
MVKSKLNSNINYHEYSHLEEEDFNYNTPLFQLQLLREPQKVVIGVGQLNYLFSKRYNVVYVPIYLFNSEMEFMKQIGVYEIPSNQVKMDESGDLDVRRLTPLLYSFVNTELLRKSRAKSAAAAAAATLAAVDPKKRMAEVNEIKKSLGKGQSDASSRTSAAAAALTVNDIEDDDDDDEDDATTTNVFGLDARQTHLLSGASILPLQTKEQSELERRQYHPNPATDLWIQKYLRNKYFNFIDNEGASDGFFAVIRDALLTQGRTTTILELRKQLADEVSDEVFRAYREKFAMYHALTRTQTRETKELVTNYNDIKRRVSSIHDRAQQQLMIAGAKKLVIEHNQKHDEMKYTKLLAGQYDYMRDVRSVDQLKERMMTSIYWPDAWAVATMERVLNMKFIMFSRDAYEAGDIDNVLQCDNGAGVESIDPSIRKRGVFEPTAYILFGKGVATTATATGGGGGGRSPRNRTPRNNMMADTKLTTYNLITYKTHGVLAFSELPYDIKLLVTTKCLEAQSGAFCLIPQFKLFQRELGIRIDEIPNESLDDLLEEVHMDSASSGSNHHRTNGAHLYTPDIVFQFYSNSNPNALPGTGAGERIPEAEKIHFHKLTTFDNWRRKLANTWNEPFMLDNHTWQSVEHYYQGSKFKNNNREFYFKFSLDSRSELSADPVLAKAAGSKSGKLNHKTIIRPSKITIDPDFFNNNRSEREIENALFAKFSQNKNLKDLLLATRNAKLVHYQRGALAEINHPLMRVRHKLRTGGGGVAR